MSKIKQISRATVATIGVRAIFHNLAIRDLARSSIRIEIQETSRLTRMNIMNLIRFVPFTHIGVTFRKFLAPTSLFLFVFAHAPANAAQNGCSTLSSPIYQVINPNTQANLLTYSQDEANNAAIRYGFTQTNGTPFSASLVAANGLIAVHRLYNASSNDFIWMTSPTEITSAVQKYGYVDQKVYFYVPSSESSCTQPVYRFFKGNKHRFVVSQADQDALIASGWQPEGIKFYAGYAVPGANNTGVPAWVNLTPYTGPTTITVNGTVIDGKKITSMLTIKAQDVVIRNSLILVDGNAVTRGKTAPQYMVYINPNASLTIQDSELYAGNTTAPSASYLNGVVSVRGQNLTLERVNIHNVVDQVSINGDNVEVRDSWLHDNLYFKAGVDLQKTDGSHADNIQIVYGSNIQLIGNNLGEGAPNLNSAVIVTQDNGIVTDMLIQGNYVGNGKGPAGNGGCSFNFKSSAAPLKGVTIEYNTFTQPGTCAMTMNEQTEINLAPSLSEKNNTWENDGSAVKIYHY